MNLRRCFAIAGLLCNPLLALSDALPDCSGLLQTGVQKTPLRNSPGWMATAKEEVITNSPAGVALSKDKAEIRSFELLASVLKNNVDKKIKTVTGAKVTQACVYKGFVYVQTWVDDASMQQAQAIKSSMADSLANHPTPRSNVVAPANKESDSASELEDLVKEMQRSHK